MKKESIKPFIFGLVVGAIVLVIVIFSAGWVMTSGSAQTEAEQIAEDAVIDRLAPICVVQFQQDPEKDQKLKELKEMSSYQRGDYVKKQGWATMPGEKEPDSKIADECARRLVELEKK